MTAVDERVVLSLQVLQEWKNVLPFELEETLDHARLAPSQGDIADNQSTVRQAEPQPIRRFTMESTPVAHNAGRGSDYWETRHAILSRPSYSFGDTAYGLRFYKYLQPREKSCHIATGKSSSHHLTLVFCRDKKLDNSWRTNEYTRQCNDRDETICRTTKLVLALSPNSCLHRYYQFVTSYPWALQNSHCTLASGSGAGLMVA